MKKVAIVGVEGSGKTVMLAGLGELYSRPDENGYYLAPKNFGTAAYVSEKIARMRKGEWPTATADDEVQGLDWTLKQRASGMRRRPKSLCEVSFLDFAGEVYRAAYGISGEGNSMLAEQVDVLRQYVRGADDLIVLINLRDVIANGLGDTRVQEAMWITKAILDTALGEDAGENVPRAAIVLSQADSYAETIKACGGAEGVLEEYLPHVANEYGWLDIFAASAVDKTVLDDNGTMVPAPDFTSSELRPIMDWVMNGLDNLDKGRDGEKPKRDPSRSKRQKAATRSKTMREDDQDDSEAQVTDSGADNNNLVQSETAPSDMASEYGMKVVKGLLCVAGGIVGVWLVIVGVRWLIENIKWFIEHWFISLMILGAISSAFDKK